MWVAVIYRLDNALLQSGTRRLDAALSTDVVAFQFSVKSRAADAQHFAGKDFVALYLLEYSFNRRSLDVF